MSQEPNSENPSKPKLKLRLDDDLPASSTTPDESANPPGAPPGPPPPEKAAEPRPDAPRMTLRPKTGDKPTPTPPNAPARTTLGL